MTLRGAPLILDVGQHGDLGRVVIHRVVRRELVIPFQLAGVGVERDHAIAIEVVAEADVAIGVRRRIADAPEGEVGVGVVSADVPDGRAAGLPRIARPGFMARLARPGDGVEAPGFLAGLRVECRDVAADGAVAARRADDHFVLDDQRRVRDGVAVGRRVADGGVPEDLPVLGVDREQVRVERSHEKRVAEDGESAIDASAAERALRAPACRGGVQKMRPVTASSAYTSLGAWMV